MTPLQQIEEAPGTTVLQFPAQPLFRNNPRTIRVALAGCGVVGGGLVRLLHESAAAITSRYSVRFVITRVLVRDTTRDRNLPIDSRLFTNDLTSFLADDADVVIEAVGGQEPARTIARTTLARGRKLITANKELISTHGETLHELAVENNTGLDFGAAVGGSAPVISTLRDLVGASAPVSVRGILNGTSNYVISEIERGATLEVALAAARARGLAESDCSRDLDGRDAAAKLSIIAWIAFGIKPAELHIRRISPVPGLEALVRLGIELGGSLRLLGECTRLADGRITASVEPVIVPVASAFARTGGEENRVEVDLGWSSPLSVSGPGAGGAPTAAALLSDLVRFSSPPNDRGAHVPQFKSAADSRTHRWLIAARIAPNVLTALATAGRVPTEEARSNDGLSWLTTRPVSWVRVRRVLNALRELNTEPCVARCELPERSEAIQ
jgi:homoserine dehydrogenase